MTRETFLSKSRIIMLNSVLSARSLYTISIFKLPTLSLKKIKSEENSYGMVQVYLKKYITW